MVAAAKFDYVIVGAGSAGCVLASRLSEDPNCKMGQDAMAVVDPQASVHGIDRLRVVDSSVMPDVTTGNLNAPTIMLAERAADIIRGRSLLPAEHVPVFASADADLRRQECGQGDPAH